MARISYTFMDPVRLSYSQSYSVESEFRLVAIFLQPLTELGGVKDARLYFLPSGTWLRQGNVFTSVCQSFFSQGGEGCLTDIPLGRHPPGRQPPEKIALGRHPLRSTPSEAYPMEAPPPRSTPLDGHCMRTVCSLLECFLVKLFCAVFAKKYAK